MYLELTFGRVNVGIICGLLGLTIAFKTFLFSIGPKIFDKGKFGINFYFYENTKLSLSSITSKLSKLAGFKLLGNLLLSALGILLPIQDKNLSEAFLNVYDFVS